MKIVDEINQKFKPNSIRSAACVIENGNFEAGRPMMTPSYCTNWSEVPTIEEVIGFNKKK